MGGSAEVAEHKAMRIACEMERNEARAERDLAVVANINLRTELGQAQAECAMLRAVLTEPVISTLQYVGDRVTIRAALAAAPSRSAEWLKEREEHIRREMREKSEQLELEACAAGQASMMETWRIALAEGGVPGTPVGELLAEHDATAWRACRLDLRACLSQHWLIGIDCDEATKTDRARCSCSLVELPRVQSVGAAVESWLDHVFAERRAHR